MATRKNPRTKSDKSKSKSNKKVPAKKAKSRKKLAKRMSAPKTTGRRRSSAKKQGGKKGSRRGARQFSQKGRRPSSGEQAGDLQGLSGREAADPESVDELLEEGNAFEAGAVMGVEDADNMDEREVQTHEVPEDDVPGEYLEEE
jgi:hypothetical protein